MKTHNKQLKNFDKNHQFLISDIELFNKMCRHIYIYIIKISDKKIA